MQYLKLFEQYIEDVLLESFQSDVLRTLVPQISDYSRSKFMWDKVSPEEIEEVDIETGKKLARKRTENNVVIWANNDKFVAITSSNYVILPGKSVNGRDSINTVSYYANKAYLFKNADKYETRELQMERRKAKENALALRNNSDIAEENVRRYKAELNKMRTIPEKDVVAALERGLEAYESIVSSFRKDVLNKIEANGTVDPFTNGLWKARETFDKLNKIVSTLMYKFNDFGSDKKDAEKNQYGYYNTSAYSAKAMKENAEQVVAISNNLQQIATDMIATLDNE